MKTWGKKEVEFIEKNISNMRLKDMSKLPLFRNRTFKALQNKASRLGLKRGKKGKNNPNWKGGEYLRDGYIWLSGKYECPYSDKRGRVSRAKYNWWEYYGDTKPILEGEVIHHINENKLDDRIENLIKVTIAEHLQELHKIEYGRGD